MLQQKDLSQVGRFAKPHGVKGELALVTDYDLFEDSEDPFLICDVDGILVPFYVESFRWKSNSVMLVKLEYVNSEESAREFVHLNVFYPTEGLGTDDSELVTWDDFVGYTVVDRTHGLLGCITDIDESTINVLLQIDYNGEALLFPAAEELIADIDHSARQLTVSVPEGLLDL